MQMILPTHNKQDEREEKEVLNNKLKLYFEEYSDGYIFIVGDNNNLSSDHLRHIHHSLLGAAKFTMGKNTLQKQVIREYVENNYNLQEMKDSNIGLVFTHCKYIKDIVDRILYLQSGFVATTGSIAPNDVIIPRGPCILPPVQTALLCDLNISSRMSNGRVELLRNVCLIKTGEIVSSSQANLLQQLKMKPFSRGLSISHYIHGNCLYKFNPHCLDINIEEIILSGVNSIASLSITLGIPTIASIPHIINNAYKQVLAVAIETEYSFPAADTIKEYIANPPPPPSLPLSEKSFDELSDAEIIRRLHEGASSEDDGHIGLFD